MNKSQIQMDTGVTKKKTQLIVDSIQKTRRTAACPSQWLYSDGVWKVCRTLYKTQGYRQEVSPFIPLACGQTGWMSLWRVPAPPIHDTTLPRKQSNPGFCEGWTKSANLSQLSPLAATTWHHMWSQMLLISFLCPFSYQFLSSTHLHIL